MSFAEQVATAIGRAHGRALDDAARTIWQGLAARLLDEEEAQSLAELAHARRNAHKTAPVGRRTRMEPQRVDEVHASRFPRRRPQRPPVRAQAIERRRRIAASGALPPQLAALFTVAETAVLAIVADEVRRRGRCDRSLDELAARAGCSRSSAKNAIRTARAHGLIRVTLRPRSGRKHLPNVVEIVDRGWRAWLKRTRSAGTGDSGQKNGPHGYIKISRGTLGTSTPPTLAPVDTSQHHRSGSVPPKKGNETLIRRR